MPPARSDGWGALLWLSIKGSRSHVEKGPCVPLPQAPPASDRRPPPGRAWPHDRRRAAVAGRRGVPLAWPLLRLPRRSCMWLPGCTARKHQAAEQHLGRSRDLVFERCRRLREPCVIQQRVRALPLNTMVRSSSGHCRAPSRGTSRVSHLTPRHTLASALTLAVPSEHETQPTLPRLLHPRPRRPRS